MEYRNVIFYTYNFFTTLLNDLFFFIYIYIYIEVNNGNESDSMKKIEKQSNPKVMILL